MQLVFFTTGWAFRINSFQIRLNRQNNYSSISFEWLSGGYSSSSGYTWTEYQKVKKNRNKKGHSK